MRVVAFSLCSLLLFASCSTSNIAYLSDLEDTAVFEADLASSKEPVIQPGDLLGITMSSQSPESNALFNSGVMLTSSNTKSINASSSLNEGYQVDDNGNISFPYIGKIQLGGLSQEEATEKVASVLSKYAKEPIVNIRITNFKVTVIGEVNRPSVVTVPAAKVNILEALGYAGDMTPFGKRESVLIIRDTNGVRSTVRVNLNSKSLLNSPYYYLQQNDIVYVEPNKAKALQSSPRTYNLPVWLSLASLGAFMVSLFL
ncbi:polysaccharide export outer membrane protein [Pontibacter ummariensis]|uniref:Polysaccharide export outer membrane protein n=1 Tax=Pontibacter ummariensis TaxID=1610492 RepID=A0A239K663_9BACT|nr:polysaccharide biosynthesis/export family protein [Pontibacter ummariensis]PRY06763.1 polysaccharide export outer membrane protein [Pontibacter ummariensis]SNT13113.1 polysaccharide export outer membrane protein [Pontibacter ummariensis]